VSVVGRTQKLGERNWASAMEKTDAQTRWSSGDLRPEADSGCNKLNGKERHTI